MILLAVVDTVFLLSSCLTFSLPKLSQTYRDQHWAYLLPYTLPIAQVLCNYILLRLFINNHILVSTVERLCKS